MTRSSEQIAELLFEVSRLRGRERAAFINDVEREHPEIGRELRSLAAHTDAPDDVLLGHALVAPAQEAFGVPIDIGDYRIVRRIGRGGLGDVYEAVRSGEIELRVAIKVIKPGLDSEAVMRRFRNERRTLAKLSHPNAARAIDAGTDSQGRPFIVMDLADGPPITEYARSHRLGIEERVRLFVQACAGVEHAHAQGVLHRDLKPSNLLVTTEGGEPHVKVIDFGMVELLHPDENEIEAFEQSVGSTPIGPVGTPEYMSPEQVDSGSLDERSDVYSLGVVLYELIADAHPHQRRALRSMSAEQLSRYLRDSLPSPPSLSGRDNAVPPSSGGLRTRELDWICLRAIDPDADRRYATVHHLRQDLERCLAGAPVTAAPPTKAYRLRKYLARNRLLVTTSSGAVGLSLLISVIATTAYVRVKEAQRETSAALAEMESSANFLADMITMSSPFELGPDVSLGHMLEQGSASLDQSLADSPRVRARLRPVFASALASVGNLEESASLFSESESETARIFGEHSREYASVIVRHSQLLERKGLYVPAQERAERALELLDGSSIDDPELLQLDALIAHARAVIGGVDLHEGVEIARRAVAFASQHDLADTRFGVSAKVVLASGLRRDGKHDEAITLLDQIGASLEDSRPGAWAERVYVMHEHAASLMHGQRLDEAIDEYDRAIALWTANMTGSRQVELKLRADQAIVYAIANRADEAVERLEVVLPLFAAEVGELAPRTLEMRVNFLSMLNEIGEHERVIREAGQLIDVLEANGQEDALASAHAYSVRGDGYSYLANEPAAGDHYAKALGIFERRGAQGLPAYRWVVGNHMATMEVLGRHEEAEISRRKYEALGPPPGQ